MALSQWRNHWRKLVLWQGIKNGSGQATVLARQRDQAGAVWGRHVLPAAHRPQAEQAFRMVCFSWVELDSNWHITKATRHHTTSLCSLRSACWDEDLSWKKAIFYVTKMTKKHRSASGLNKPSLSSNYLASVTRLGAATCKALDLQRQRPKHSMSLVLRDFPLPWHSQDQGWDVCMSRGLQHMLRSSPSSKYGST